MFWKDPKYGISIWVVPKRNIVHKNFISLVGIALFSDMFNDEVYYVQLINVGMFLVPWSFTDMSKILTTYYLIVTSCYSCQTPWGVPESTVWGNEG